MFESAAAEVDLFTISVPGVRPRHRVCKPIEIYYYELFDKNPMESKKSWELGNVHYAGD